MKSKLHIGTKLILSVLCVSLAMSITACSTIQSAFTKGAEANDALVTGSIRGLCFAYSVGSIKRKFKTAEDKDTYDKLCKLEESGSLGSSGGDG